MSSNTSRHPADIKDQAAREFSKTLVTAVHSGDVEQFRQLLDSGTFSYHYRDWVTEAIYAADRADMLKAFEEKMLPHSSVHTQGMHNTPYTKLQLAGVIYNRRTEETHDTAPKPNIVNYLFDTADLEGKMKLAEAGLANAQTPEALNLIADKLPAMAKDAGEDMPEAVWVQKMLAKICKEAATGIMPAPVFQGFLERMGDTERLGQILCWIAAYPKDLLISDPHKMRLLCERITDQEVLNKAFMDAAGNGLRIIWEPLQGRITDPKIRGRALLHAAGTHTIPSYRHPGDNITALLATGGFSADALFGAMSAAIANGNSEQLGRLAEHVKEQRAAGRLPEDIINRLTEDRSTLLIKAASYQHPHYIKAGADVVREGNAAEISLEMAGILFSCGAHTDPVDGVSAIDRLKKGGNGDTHLVRAMEASVKQQHALDEARALGAVENERIVSLALQLRAAGFLASESAPIIVASITKQASSPMSAIEAQGDHTARLQSEGYVLGTKPKNDGVTGLPGN